MLFYKDDFTLILNCKPMGMKKIFRNLSLILFSIFCRQGISIAQKIKFPKHPVNPQNIHITWDSSTLRYAADGGYARMVELKNGILAIVYAARNGNVKIVFSNDKGNHWSSPTVVAAEKNGIRMDAPGILLLKDNSLMVCYNPRPSARKHGYHKALRDQDN